MWNNLLGLLFALLVKIINGIFLAFIEFDTQSVSCTGRRKGREGNVLELGNIKLFKL